jgi:hypothetical protein
VDEALFQALHENYETMKKVIFTVIVTLAVLAGGFYVYILSGAYDISQLVPHNSLTKNIIQTVKHRSIDKRMETVTVPGNLNDTALLIAGFVHYNEMCTDCHGAPGVSPDEMAEGLYPKPPKIYKRAHEKEAQEFFWIIKNGIKMTGMPAYAPTHDDVKIWAITAFVTQKLSTMSSEEYKAWVDRYAGSGQPE